jgi:hypothetical protein
LPGLYGAQVPNKGAKKTVTALPGRTKAVSQERAAQCPDLVLRGRIGDAEREQVVYACLNPGADEQVIKPRPFGGHGHVTRKALVVPAEEIALGLSMNRVRAFVTGAFDFQHHFSIPDNHGAAREGCRFGSAEKLEFDVLVTHKNTLRHL